MFLATHLIGFGSIKDLPDYFVDATGGNDGNDGKSAALPWKTLSQVNGATFEVGDKIAFKRGEEWRETLTVPRSGVAGAPVVFTAYDQGNDPIFNGSDLVTGWTDNTGNVWFATVTWTGVRGWFFNGTKGTDLTDATDVVPGGNTALVDVDGEGDWFHDEGINRFYVFSTSDPDTRWTAPGVEICRRAQNMKIDAKSYIDVINIKLAKGNTQGSTVDNSSTFINFTTCTAEFNQGDGFDNRSSSSDITYLNCTADDNGIVRGMGLSKNNNGHGIDLEAVSNVTITGLIANGNSEQGIQTKTTTGANITIDRCTIKDSAEAGIGIKGGTNLTIQDCVLDQTGGTGRTVPTETGTNGSVGIINVGVNEAAATYTFQRNRITGMTRASIYHSTSNVALGTLNIYSNIIHDTDDYGIWIEDDDSGLTVNIIHNSFYRVGEATAHGAMIIQGDNTMYVMKNNAVFSDAAGTNEALDSFVPKAQMTDQNNDWFITNGNSVTMRDPSTVNYNNAEINDGTYTAAEGLGQNTIANDPTFNNPAGLDFTPQTGSPIIATGQSGTGVTVDFNGARFDSSTPNMGAVTGSV